MKPLQIPNIYKEVLIDKKAPVKVFYSGRSAAKSHSFARAILYLGSFGPLRIVCGRQYQRSIDDSVHSLLSNIIKEHGLNYNIFKSYITNSLGTRITFIGLDRSLGSVKGLEGVDIFWIEESQYLTQQALDIVLPTIRRNKGAELWISMNINTDEDPAYREFIVNQRPGSIVKKTSYRDNPFLDDSTIQEAMWCLKHDPQKYANIWDGEALDRSESLVFNNWEVGSTISDKKAEELNLTPYFGLDFGSTDPTAMVKVYVLEEERELHIVAEAYKTEVEIDDLPEFIRQIPGANLNFITADSARPDTIKFLQKRGFYIDPAQKGPGSIVEGVEFIKNYKVIINPGCKNAIYEFSHYSHEIDKMTDMIKPGKFVDRDNHVCDCTRYALEAYRQKVNYTIVS